MAQPPKSRYLVKYYREIKKIAEDILLELYGVVSGVVLDEVWYLCRLKIHSIVPLFLLLPI